MVRKATDQIEVTWDKCDDGSSNSCRYNLKISKDGRQEGTIIETNKLSYIKYLAMNDLGHDYNFCVSAVNSCGHSPPTCTK